MSVELGRIIRYGRALYITFPKHTSEQLPWNPGDRVALRVAGEKIIVERVPMESLAKLRTGEVHPI